MAVEREPTRYSCPNCGRFLFAIRGQLSGLGWIDTNCPHCKHNHRFGGRHSGQVQVQIVLVSPVGCRKRQKIVQCEQLILPL